MRVKFRADSLTLASVNLAVSILVYLSFFSDILNLDLLFIAWTLFFAVPILSLWTVVRAAGDLVRPESRWQALLALALTIPCAVLVEMVIRGLAEM